MGEFFINPFKIITYSEELTESDTRNCVCQCDGNSGCQCHCTDCHDTER